MSSLQKQIFRKSRLAPLESVLEDDAASESSQSSRRSFCDEAKYLPSSWHDCFDTFVDVKMNSMEDVFRVYLSNIDHADTVFAVHHGAGHSGLSFALLSKHIKELSGGRCGVVALDCRGHGDTVTKDALDISLDRLSDDFANVVGYILQDTPRNIILVGHSMGGAVIVDVARRKRLENVIGVVVLDVVEGSALDSLPSMNQFLSTVPKQFNSVPAAIKWSVKCSTLKNLNSAKISIPPIIKPSQEDESKWVWRVDLAKTEAFWQNWYTGLSEKFLSCTGAKLLILAGTDRLDKTLMIGQMQGKFQLNVFPEAGHFLHEDVPEHTAETLISFWERNQRLVLPPKVRS
ncbi:Alpha/Beta hydrolase protein [Radiomyces spectabilis]|uniref:Alpha/Beta hydrolase protein n=1 Tax=Radiomyces spectabilis TaxID=64574 RepID=UPI00221F2AE7|nr:Alpha/Beta hydrolase protein [Radiomyces spectabilis]KAI8394273.1 Alpha/Beta hydrolase protein [Radiomyces spectabilis]